MSSIVCPQCKEKNNPAFISCWKCGSQLGNSQRAADLPTSDIGEVAIVFERTHFGTNGFRRKDSAYSYDNINGLAFGHRSESVNGMPIKETLDLKMVVKSAGYMTLTETLDIRPVIFSSKKREEKKQRNAERRKAFYGVIDLIAQKVFRRQLLELIELIKSGKEYSLCGLKGKGIELSSKTLIFKPKVFTYNDIRSVDIYQGCVDLKFVKDGKLESISLGNTQDVYNLHLLRLIAASSEIKNKIITSGVWG